VDWGLVAEPWHTGWARGQRTRVTRTVRFLARVAEWPPPPSTPRSQSWLIAAWLASSKTEGVHQSPLVTLPAGLERPLGPFLTVSAQAAKLFDGDKLVVYDLGSTE